ncbi:hypothetical protein WA026_016456 [Henosepilachna vigintioctopunctata]|uniref:Uncharacterized protein n=1 Tax=Henosepilachna vigintioctopunctata TaxID=420089 RepID=A0AAW1UM56_9CUCU
MAPTPENKGFKTKKIIEQGKPRKDDLETKIDIGNVKLPENLNDDYFRRERKNRSKKEEGDIFQTKKKGHKVSDQRKADQKVVDKLVHEAIRKQPYRKVLLGYLSAMFGLKSQYPPRIQF